MNVVKIVLLLSKEIVLRILSLSFKSPRTVQEFSAQLNRPIAMCYKEIRKLELLGLIKSVTTKLSKKGKSVKCYQSQVKSAHIFFERGKLRIRLELAQLENQIYDEAIDLLEE